MRLLGTTHTLSPVAHHQSAAPIERSHAEVLRHLRAIVQDLRVRDTVSKFLPIVRKIMWTTVSHSTGTTPAMRIFGPVIDLNRGFLPANAGNFIPSTDNDKYLAQLSQALLSIAQVSQLHIIKTRSAAQLRLDSTAPKRKPEFSVGDWVVLKNSTKEDKLSTKFRGPSRVTEIQDNNNYKCLNIVTNWQDVYHIGELHQFYPKPGDTPAEFAFYTSGDNQENTVEFIVSHRNLQNSKRLRDLEFLVHWLGFPDSEDSWEPYSGLNKVHQLSVYAAQHPELKIPIPK
jgi:hypothetical protein